MTDITITGNLGADARINTAGGSLVANFSLGYTPRKKNANGDFEDAGPTLWFDVSAWNELADKWGDDLVKGARVQVSGTLGSRKHEERVYTTIRAEMLRVIPPRQDRRPSSASSAASHGYAPASASTDPWANVPASDEPPF